MWRPASLVLALVSVVGLAGCPPLLPPLVSCEDEGTCETTTGAGTSSSDGTTHAGVHTSTGTSADESGEGTGTGSGDSTGTPDGTSGSSTTGSTGETTTTGMEPFCGDGVVNQDDEECDDGALGPDGPCSPLCKRERIIFVLSIIVNGELSGLQGADAYCKSQATKAQEADPTSPIKDANNFKALLPSSTVSISERHFHGEGRYRLVNGLTVSDSFDKLFTEPLKVAIDVTEFGETHVTGVWTASTADGQRYPGIDFCSDWTSVKGSASWGVSDHTDAQWIEVPDTIIQQPTEHCLAQLALYCVEQQ